MIEVIKQCLPTYEVVRTLGEGIYGTVYALEDGLKSRAAKVVPLMAERSRSANSRTDLDAKISQDFYAVQEYYGKVEGPGVVKVHDFHLVGKEVNDTVAKGYLVILMELCDKNLRDFVLDKNAALTKKTAVRIMRELAEVLHRLTTDCGDTFLVTDLKPSNLLFNANGDLLVGDLGGLKRLSSVSSVNRAQFTPNWSAPETILKAEPATVPAIVYSYGLVSYFVWEGALPYENEDFIARVQLIREKGVTFSRKMVPEPARELIRSCLAFEPQDRPAGFGPILDLLPSQAPEVKTPASRSSASDSKERSAEAAPATAAPPETDAASSDPAKSGSKPFRLQTCPSCGSRNRVPRSANIKKARCTFCGGPLVLSFLPTVKSYLETVLICAAAWVFALLIEIGLSSVLGGKLFPWALSWSVAGALTAVSLHYVLPTLTGRHVLLAVLGFTLGGALARQTGQWGGLLWFTGWTLSGFSLSLSLRYAQPAFSKNLVAVNTLGWALASLTGLAIYSSLGLAATDLFRANSQGDTPQIILQNGVTELFAALMGITVTFLLIRRAQNTLRKTGGMSRSRDRKNATN
ncbi:MAG: protein kinase [Thermodesulfobacteriota bacterium]